MSVLRGLSQLLVPLCWIFVCAADDANKPAGGTTTAHGPAATNSSRGNTTQSGGGGVRTPEGLFPDLKVDSSMIQRALYVLIGITMIGVLYFLVRAVR